MTGTKAGATKLRETMIAKYGSEEAWKARMKELGRRAQQSYLSKPKEERKPRGFAANKLLARTAGSKGGRISRRGTNA
jgi:hypothetical protein